MQPPYLVELQKCLGKVVMLGSLTVLQLWHSRIFRPGSTRLCIKMKDENIWGYYCLNFHCALWISLWISISALESSIVQKRFLSRRTLTSFSNSSSNTWFCILQNKGDQIVSYGATYVLLEQVTWSRVYSSDYVSQEPTWSQFRVALIALTA